MVLKANDRRTSCPCHDEFRGPRSDYVRQLQETKLPERLISTTNERRLVQGHEAPLRVKGDIEDGFFPDNSIAISELVT
ncbi:hypothetical protein TNCV_2686831 [Trichonephila clavipes]|nr:hypothetical protein TNCV_2686831 [Trichonephila clavipes]